MKTFAVFLSLLIPQVFNLKAQLLTLRQAAEQHVSGITFGTSLRYHELINQQSYPLYVPYAINQFNTITPEYSCKWEAIQPNNKFDYDWTGCDYIYNFALQNNLEMTFHTLIYDTFIPNWLKDVKSAAELENILETFITTVLTRYAGDSIYLWDVVNEAIVDEPNENNIYRNNYFYNILPNYIQLSFQFARNANPNTKLFYNDFNIIMTSPWMENKANAVYDMIVDLINNNIPIDGIGFQCHFYVVDYNDIMNSRDRVISNLQRFADLNLEIHITEIDVDCGYWDLGLERRVPCSSFTPELEEQQAEIYQFMLEICLLVPACTSFETWGISDEITFHVGGYPLPFDNQWEPKLAAFYMLDTLAPGATLNYGDDISLNTPEPTGPTLSPTDKPTESPVILPPSTGIPTGIPTQIPSNVPTAMPVNGNNGGTGNNIVIKNHDSNGLWWMALYVENENVNVNVINLEIRDSYNNNGGSDNSDWISASYQASWGDKDPFVIGNSLGRPYVLPLDIRLTNQNGDVLVGYGVVSDTNPGSKFDFGSNF